jgi:hypothetical protein
MDDEAGQGVTRTGATRRIAGGDRRERKAEQVKAEVKETGRMECEWRVEARGTTAALTRKWASMLPEWTWELLREDDVTGWPLCVVGTGNDIGGIIGNGQRTPEWVIVDGGEFHKTSVRVLEKRHLKKWGIRGSLSVWGVNVERDHELRRYQTVEKMVERVNAAVQVRLRKAYNAVGGARFKKGTRTDDFNFEAVGRTLAANPGEVWGEERSREDWKLQRKWEWPEEPTTEALRDDDDRLKGIETKEEVTEKELQERRADLTAWKAGGMSWIDGFSKEGRKKVLRFLHENDMAMTAVMEMEGTSKTRKFGKVEDVLLEQTDYRPGARGKLWVWEDGIGRELTATTIEQKVEFKVGNVCRVAAMVGVQGQTRSTNAYQVGGHARDGKFPVELIRIEKSSRSCYTNNSIDGNDGREGKGGAFCK